MSQQKCWLLRTNVKGSPLVFVQTKNFKAELFLSKEIASTGVSAAGGRGHFVSREQSHTQGLESIHPIPTSASEAT